MANRIRRIAAGSRPARRATSATSMLVDDQSHHGHAGQSPAAMRSLSASDVIRLQGQAGNSAVARLVAAGRAAPIGRPAGTALLQREFQDGDKVAEDSPGYLRAPAAGPETAVASAERKNEFGEIDGTMASKVAPHAFTDGGRTGESSWHHCGGGGGKGNETLGEITLVAPIYKSAPPSKPGKQAKAWIKKGTGTLKVKRSYMGVTHGAQGAFTAPPPPGGVWMSPRAKDRVDKHEREHIKKTKEIHKTYIQPLEDRISKYRGIIKSKKAGTDAATAIAALQTEIDWNASVQSFADEDTRENTPMGPVDTTDMNKADFYGDFDSSAKFAQSSGCAIYEGVGPSKKGKT